MRACSGGLDLTPLGEYGAMAKRDRTEVLNSGLDAQHWWTYRAPPTIIIKSTRTESDCADSFLPSHTITLNISFAGD